MITVEIAIDYSFPNVSYPVISKTTLNNGVVMSKTLATYEEGLIAIDLEEFYLSFKNHIASSLDYKKTIEEEKYDKKRDLAYYEMGQAMDYFRKLMSEYWKEDAL